MAIKRKRSSPTFSSPASDISASSTYSFSNGGVNPIPAYYPNSRFTTQFSFLDGKQTYFDSEERKSQLNSRTRKRHRDDRPESEDVYGVSDWIGAVIQMSALADVCRVAANTIARLYAAQRERPHAEPILSHTTTSISRASNETLPMTVDAPPKQKTSLHSFWNIPQSQPPAPSTTKDYSMADVQDTRCQDCEGELRSRDGMDIDGETLIQDASCAVCNRHVCDTCAVLGDSRICLSCISSHHF